ncbi:MAG: hypothetical protein DMG49_08065 [Acidobacteria bacterium]|nr:MAG: hypothetical protein DMG49_08065 [Acidobacteriota bacterium]
MAKTELGFTRVARRFPRPFEFHGLATQSWQPAPGIICGKVTRPSFFAIGFYFWRDSPCECFAEGPNQVRIEGNAYAA